MDEPFAISVNCSSILPDNDNTQYKMFVDQNRMTIVYELIEWIRWIFSVKGCFHLTFDNSIIHELEDIKVLAKLENLELKLCGQTNCPHTKLYRTLLKTINFYVEWKDTKVPKYFLEKINNMEVKLDLKSHIMDLNKSVRTKENSTNTYHSSSEQNYFFNKSEENKQTIYAAAEEKRNLNTNKDGDADDLYKNLNSVEQERMEVINQSIELSKTPKKNLTCTNEQKSEFSEKIKKVKRHKNIKPFSIGELLSNIREECKQQRNGTENVEPESPESSEIGSTSQNGITSAEKEHDSTHFSFENSLKRKRKRTRRGGKKVKQKLLELNQSSASAQNETPTYEWNFKKSSKEASHIRFDDEIEEDETNEKENSSTKCEEDRNVESINEKTNSIEEIFSMINHKKRALEFLKESSPITKPENCSSQKEENLVHEKLEEIKKSPVAENNEFCNFNADSNALLQLKEKFPSPVVIERFY